jgi:hypothetical protein
MNRILLFLLASILFSSCDTASFTQIINTSDKNIEVTVAYNKKELNKLPGRKPIKPYIRDKGKLLTFDSLHIVAKFRLLPKDTLNLSTTRGSSPSFQFIKSITIFGKDTVLLDSEKAMRDRFKESGEGTFALEAE